VQISGSFDQISETLEQLAWLAAALRPHRSSQLLVSEINFRAQQALVRDSFETTFHVSLFSPTEVSQPDCNEPGQCWTSLFTESVLAYGFPIHGENRPIGILGLEVPFEIMAAFAGVKFPVLLGDRVVFAGESSLLIPEAASGDSIQWHFLGSDDRFERALQRHKGPDPNLQTFDLQMLTTSRAFLGYCRTSEVLLGTAQFEDVSISESGVPRTGPKLTLKLEGPLSAGVNVKGYATLTGGTTWRFNGGESGLIRGDQLDLDERFKRAARTAALLYDDRMCRAFLVSELSIVLHMVSAYLQKDSLLRKSKIPHAIPSADGGEAAYKAIKHAQNLMVRFRIGGPRRYTDIVDGFITIIEQRKLQAARRREEVEVSLKVGLRGWDYADLQEKSYDFWERELPTKLLMSRPIWWKLFKKSGVIILFGRDVGCPVRSCITDHGQVSCSAWAEIPEGEHLLLASMVPLLKLKRDSCQNADKFRSRYMLTNKLAWARPTHSRLFEQDCEQGRFCNPVQTICKASIIKEISWKVFKGRYEKVFRQHPGDMEPAGAVLFADNPGSFEARPCRMAQPPIELPSIDILKDLKANEDGEIRDKEGNVLGKITEGDPADLAGMPINAEGEVLDEDGDIIGRAEVVPREVKDKAAEAEDTEEAKEDIDGVQARVQEAQEGVKDAQKAVDDLAEQLAADLTILEGRKLNKKGNIIDDEGEVIGKLVEGHLKKCAGKIPNEKGDILDDKRNVIGKVEIVEGGAANEAMKALHPELAGKLQEALQKAEKEAEKGATGGLPGLDILEGFKVNKRGEVINEDGDPIAKLSEGDLDQVRGKKINDKGDIVGKDGKVIGRVELIPSAFKSVTDQVEEAAAELRETSILEGLKVNKKGEVLNEDGEPIARLSVGELADVVGKKLNDKAEVLDKGGNVIGKVEMISQQAEEAAPEEESGEDLNDKSLPLSILEGLKYSKAGKIIDASGKPVEELLEGDLKKLAKLGITCDDQGQFWDTKGHVIGRAKALPQEDQEDVEAEFAGLEGLIVVKDGWVEDENGNRVSQLTEGDAKKLIGRAINENGDVLDKRCNVIGHTKWHIEPEVKGLTVNKAGNIIGPQGVPIGRLVEGNPKELAGRKIDGEGQIRNDSGEVVGRCELIPADQREEKPEDIFGGLEGLVVIKDGLVEDYEGNVVGKVIEGDPKKLIGRAVDEDGEIVDKYGNVKGRCDPYEIPKEEEVVTDLSSLGGKTVNKQGNVVDAHGNSFGHIIGGELKRLFGYAVDGQGQIIAAVGLLLFGVLIRWGVRTFPQKPRLKI
jgi:hypothetical protein